MTYEEFSTLVHAAINSSDDEHQSVVNELWDKLPNRFFDGYTGAIDDASRWIRDTVNDWYALKIFDSHQTLALKELEHAFDLNFRYELRGPE